MTASTSAAASRASAIARGRSAATLRAIASGEQIVTDVLVPKTAEAEASLDTVARVRTERLLRSIPGVGEYTANQVCNATRVDRGTRIESLSPARRQQLADAVNELDLATYRGTGPRRRVAS